MHFILWQNWLMIYGILLFMCNRMPWVCNVQCCRLDVLSMTALFWAWGILPDVMTSMKRPPHLIWTWGWTLHLGKYQQLITWLDWELSHLHLRIKQDHQKLFQFILHRLLLGRFQKGIFIIILSKKLPSH